MRRGVLLSSVAILLVVAILATLKSNSLDISQIMLLVASGSIAAVLLPWAFEYLLMVGRVLTKRRAAASTLAIMTGLSAGSVAVLLAAQPLQPLSPTVLSITLAVLLVGVGGITTFSTYSLWLDALQALPAGGLDQELHGDLIDAVAMRDGRVVELARYGLLKNKLTVQCGTDSRSQRFLGLLKEMFGAELSEESPDVNPIELASKRHLRIVTMDPNVAVEAAKQGMPILDVATVIRGVRPQLRRGSKLTIKLVHKGTQNRQAVGFLDDGTPVVVGQAEDLIGRTVPVIINRYLEQPTGRMVFADIEIGTTMTIGDGLTQRIMNGEGDHEHGRSQEMV